MHANKQLVNRPLNKVLPAELYLFRILRITDFKAITIFWRRQESPAIRDWLDLDSKVDSMERMTYEIKSKILILKSYGHL